MALEAQNNPFTSILMVEAADPQTLPDADPAVGQRRLAVGTDHLLYLVSDAGVKTLVGGAGIANPLATDSLWDAAGDIVQGTGANTAAKLGAGSAGKVLTSNGAAAALTWETPAGGGITSGTSNPGSPTNGDLFYRSDLDLLIRYRSSGTRWVCVCPHVQPFMLQTAVYPFAANASLYTGVDVTSFGLFVERVSLATLIPSGTNNGSHFWTIAVVNITMGSSIVTSADGNTGTRHDITGGTITAGTTIYAEMTATKTGSPGNLYLMQAGLVYRYIVT